MAKTDDIERDEATVMFYQNHPLSHEVYDADVEVLEAHFVQRNRCTL